MPEKSYYILVSAEDYEELEKLVNKYHREGYIAQGGVSVLTTIDSFHVHTFYFIQAMTLVDGMSQLQFEYKVQKVLENYAQSNS